MLNIIPTHYLLEIAEEILQFQNSTEWLLKLYFRKHRNIGKNERYLITEVIYTLLRNREKILSFLTATQQSTVANQVYLAEYLYLQENTPQPVQELGVQYVEFISKHNLSLEVQAELPKWITEKLLKKYSTTQIIELGISFQSQAPLDIRTNISKIKRNALITQLQQEQLEVSPTPYSPWGIRLANNPRITENTLYEQGYFEIQDEGSQLIAYFSKARKNMTVVDFCAGTGGKTLALAEMMHHQGSIYAFDTEVTRLNQLKTRLNKLGISMVYPSVIENENAQKLSKLMQKCDLVVVDAPCSGTGTLRRQPDLKYRQNKQIVEDLTQLQLSILSAASRLCRRGARLIYSTCSILPEENEKVAEEFLASHTNFKNVDCQAICSSIKITNVSNMINLNPIETKTDGFFIAMFEKL